MTIELAIYDMDRTITYHPTWTPFLIHAACRRQKWRLLFLPLVALAMLSYLMHFISRGRLKEITHALLLGRHIAPKDLAPLAESFAEETILNNIRPGALKSIEADRKAGRRLVMATASYRLYADLIAKKLGFDDVIATNSTIRKDGHLIARIEGENNYGPAKLRMILAWMTASDLERQNCHIRFYSDHVSDEPVFQWSDAPFAINPCRRLAVLAKKEGWPCLDWKHN
ncbi:MAG: HAD-IB family phosphatase [Zymomonas mobilis subsp. pomaceae]|uniref:HAD-superfamily subfamily IB hydrolase, TIGR01490 n=1 Tax=Zymomonas mobilis subsp. pomaceae (strain ATCC 29192 / DSM 22645 / JCM 10191 / CCUG 17912 / NBRC 13757 / NCIMB 11200 / NRRL B-4491 / Barker I) TaxID=579138 RepID=F8ERL5_ZYMMT|nr:HAD-IB family phosphatase [Zymomonas mobilis]AEI37473.1 HAD-superfamily subfamily IB hydrolase, TIGR01490 [Zymomonas mobilis subsp. pomaceae ATCC 29192]MDX5948841.1 HAD-IB family phosphatase [Zymomonas mobilis subsp. pomaceae]GEB88648.1 hypothetical protein ZMO02_02850 [Zymomonas mobilis subsp. pomaceae]